MVRAFLILSDNWADEVGGTEGDVGVQMSLATPTILNASLVQEQSSLNIFLHAHRSSMSAAAVGETIPAHTSHVSVFRYSTISRPTFW
jgi:hypothetical protein